MRQGNCHECVPRSTAGTMACEFLFGFLFGFIGVRAGNMAYYTWVSMGASMPGAACFLSLRVCALAWMPGDGVAVVALDLWLGSCRACCLVSCLAVRRRVHFGCPLARELTRGGMAPVR